MLHPSARLQAVMAVLRGHSPKGRLSEASYA